MRKEFRLEKLLEIRIMEERHAAAKLSELDAQLNRVQGDLELIKKKQSQLYAEFVNSVQNQGSLASLQSHLSALKEKSLELENQLENIKKNKEVAYNFYLNALKKRKILDNLKEKTVNSAKNS